ncbi:MAG: aspartate aminotransferase family protein [Streptosporangiaceae bacterium]|nr:aspartate aminotransferase family protein [Streptosporangiaceae bacterium]
MAVGTHMANAFDAAGSAELSERERSLLDRRMHSLAPMYRLFYESPVSFVRAEGVFLFDGEGRSYLDAYNNVPVVGHANAAVAEAVSRQMRTLNTHTRYLNELNIDYAEELLARFPAELDRVAFACSGSEAVDLALRVMRYTTGGQGIIVTRNAYHGTTSAAAEISPSLGQNNALPLSTVVVDAPDTLRDDPATSAAGFAERVERAIAVFAERGIRFAGMIADTALSSDGLQLEPTGFLARAATVVREHGGLFTADEVQAGFGRLGTWWGFIRHGLVPDLVVLGKPMANGMPVSGLVGSEEVFGRFGTDVRYFNTFAGAEVGMSAAREVLAQVGGGLVDNSERIGGLLRETIRAASEGVDAVAQVRGAGLYAGIEFVRTDGSLHPDAEFASRVTNGLRMRRVLTSVSGGHENVLKVRPPLVFGEEHVAILGGAYRQALEEAVAFAEAERLTRPGSRAG